MFDSNLRARYLSVVLLASLALVTGCDRSEPAGPGGGGEDDEEIGSTSAPLIEGRKVTVSKDSTLSSNDLSRMQTNLTHTCIEQVAKAGTPGLTTPGIAYTTLQGICEPSRVMGMFYQIRGTDSQAQVRLCIAHLASEIAGSVTPLYLVTTAAAAGEGSSATFEALSHEPPSAKETPYRTIPPQGASDAASWSLLASENFREAALEYSRVLVNCPDALPQTFDVDSNPQTPAVPYAQTVAANLSDAMSGLVESAERAREYLHAAGKAQHATGKDPQLGRVHAWRHAYDSLLRASSAYVTVPHSLYEPASLCEGLKEGCGSTRPGCLSSGLSGADLTACNNTYPVMTALTQSAKDRRAEQLLRDNRIDPQIGPGRTVEQIANELLRAISLEYRGAYNNLVQSGSRDGLVFLERTGITQADLKLACDRIVQSSRVLGQPLIAKQEPIALDLNRDGDTTDEGESVNVSRAYDMRRTSSSASPWYLYATTETAELPPLANKTLRDTDGSVLSSEPGHDGSVLSAHYARRGVFHALDYFRDTYRRYVRDNETLDPGAKDILASASAFANSYVQGTIGVDVWSTNDPAGPFALIRSADVRIRMDNEPTHTSLEERMAWFRQTYDVWVGEEGLNCALGGLDASGKPCDPREHKFHDEDTDGVQWATYPPVAQTTFVLLSLEPKYAPCATGMAEEDGANCPSPYGTEAAPLRPRLYVTERLCGLAVKRPSNECVTRVLAGFTMNPPRGPNWHGFSIPVGTGIEDALRASLGADPNEPDEAEFECGDSGMKRGLKLGLESELTQSVGKLGDNLVEESFAYYLDLADQAAKEADTLGDQLVQQGLEMDTRAEEAREALEGVCGGVIDVDRIRKAACNGAGVDKCDFMKFLESPEAGMDADLLPLRKCLGITELGNATLGPYPVCTWQIEGSAPCECPKDDAGNPLACPESCLAPLYPTTGLGEGFRRAQAALGTVARREGDCPSAFKDMGGAGTYDDTVTFSIISRVLSLTPPIVPEESVPEYPCTRLMQMRAGDIPFGAADKTLDWDMARFAEVAKNMTVHRNDINSVVVKYPGREWKTTGGADNPWGNNSGFPCAPHPAAANFDCNDPKYQASLLCGLGCAIPTGHPINDPQAIEALILRQKAGERLAKAVELMRVISNAGLSGIEVAFPPAVWNPRAIPADELPDSEPNTPFWRDLAAGPFNRDGWTRSNERLMVDSTEGLRLRAADRQLKAEVLCRVDRYMNEGEGDDIDFCRGSYDKKEETAETMRKQRFYGTYYRGYKSDQVTASVRQVCIEDPEPGTRDADTFDRWHYPFNKEVWYIDQQFPYLGTLPNGAKLLPPPCLPDSSGRRVMTFVDAGLLVNWPKLDAHQADRFWKRLNYNLDLAFAASSEGEQASSLAPSSGFSVGLPDNSVNIHVSEGLWRSYTARDYNGLSHFGQQNLLDAFELACLAANPNYEPVTCDMLKDTDTFNGTEDLARMATTLNCRAEDISRLLDTVTLANAPVALIDAFEQRSLLNTSGEFGGQYAESVTRLYNAILGIGSGHNSLQSQTRLMATVYANANAQVTATGLAADIEVQHSLMAMELADNECTRSRWSILTAIARGAAAGVEHSTESVTSLVFAPYTAGAHALVEGADAALQSHFACNAEDITKKHHTAIQSLIDQRKDAQITSILQATSGELINIHINMESASDAIKSNFAEAQAALAEMQTLRNQAHAAVANMLMLDSDAVDRQFNVNTTMRARMNTLRVRYENARKYAVRTAYLARRSIEQKLGMNLSELTDNVGWVPAPRTWADTLCSLTGINYDEIRDSGMQDKPTNGQVDDKGYNYANQYVGDYVQRLRELITAYENTYTSGTGRDSVVVSVRDELLNVRNLQCNVSGANELLQAAQGLNVAPAEMTPEDALEYEAEKVWQDECDPNGVCVTAASVTSAEDQPFVCYKRDANGELVVAALEDDEESDGLGADCPSGGAARVRPVRLLAAPSGDSVAEGGSDAPPTPPMLDLVQWFRADSCTLTSPNSQSVSSCPNLARSGVISANTPSATRLIAAGIGGRPTVEVNNSLMQGPDLGIDTEHFTVSFVYRATEPNQVFYGNSVAVFPDGSNRAGTAEINGQSGRQFAFTWRSSPANETGPSASVGIAMPSAPEDDLHAGNIATLVVDGANGLRLYANGALVGGSPLAVPELRMSSTIIHAVNASVGQLAEHVSYNRTLSETELVALHRYLGARYGISTTGPTRYLDAAEILRARDNGGVSPASGYTMGAYEIRDRVYGGIYARQTPDATRVPSGPTREFGGDQDWVGLRFDGDDLLWLPYLATRYESSEQGGEPTWMGWTPVQRDIAHTLVVRVDSPEARQDVFRVSLADGGALLLTALPQTGALRVTRVFAGGAASSYVTDDGVIAEGVPFIVTLRGSADEDAHSLYVNGERHLTLPGFVAHGSGTLGAGEAAGLIGSIAAYQSHSRAMSDADVAALHARLRTTHIAGVPANDGADADASPRVGTASIGLPTYGQWVNLVPGKYILSWYSGIFREDGAVLYAAVTDTDGEQLQFTDGAGGGNLRDERWLAPGWARFWRSLDVSRAGDYFVTFGVPYEPSNPAVASGVLLAAPQLERVDDVTSIGPSTFFPTDDDYAAPIGICDDKNGDKFRAGYWGIGCEYYCPSGLGVECARLAQDPSGLPQRCYHELKFHLSQEEIESGKLLSQAGFARGNFNYRFEDVAVNVVGTAVKDCEHSETPSSCYAANFLQYTLVHEGPFLVRNYFGEDYEAPLYPGRIQQSKALLAERYLTNPLSSADNSLLQRYWDTELVGRPMAGNYTLRVYDADGLNWNALQDVQLVMNYRYWTRAE